MAPQKGFQRDFNSNFKISATRYFQVICYSLYILLSHLQKKTHKYTSKQAAYLHSHETKKIESIPKLFSFSGSIRSRFFLRVELQYLYFTLFQKRCWKSSLCFTFNFLNISFKPSFLFHIPLSTYIYHFKGATRPRKFLIEKKKT